MSCCHLPPVDKMDDFGEDELPLGRSSPRRQLQGPRPTPLKVHKDSHKIKKPPIPPPQNHHHHHHHNHNHNQQQPLIIYTISPKVIHTNPCDFMSLVQRLTGPSTNSTATTTSTSSGTLSPAARFAAIEKTKPQHQYNNPSHDQDSSTTSIHPDGGGGNIAEEEDQQVGGHQYHHHTNNSTTASSFPGILSPHPSTLPPISPNFFSPLPDPNSFNFLHDMSPLFNFSNNNKNFIEGTFVPSPTTNFFSSSPTVLTSPTLSFDLFNHFLDF